MSSSVPAQRLALVDLLRSLFPDDAVSYGRPVTLSARMAHLGQSRVPTNEQHSLNGSARRSRREQVENDVVLSAFIRGNPDVFDDAQRQATESAYEMLDALEDHFRSAASPPLATGCMPSIVSSHEMEILPAYGSNEIIVGWTCDITATVSTTATI